MKKFAIGCAVALLLVLVVGGVLGYVFVLRPARAYIASFQQLGQIPEIEKQVANKTPFEAPSTNELTEQMVTRFVAVQQQMQQSLGPKFDELKAKYDQIDRVQKAEHREPTFTEAMGAIKDLTTIFVMAKRAQVEALNKAGFSLDEYSWVRGRVYNAAGIVMSEMDLSRLADSAKKGQMEMRKTADELVPDQNKQLVQPYAKQLQEWAPLAFFGL